MEHADFLNLLEFASNTLQNEALTTGFTKSSQFEKRVREVLADAINQQDLDVEVDFDSHVQAFPDICLGKYGIEVKFTEKDTWRGIANSVSQKMKDADVETIYILWCKMGRNPQVRYRPYEDVVMHVRTSHVPRFEIDMETHNSLFKQFKITYSVFSALSMEEKMDLIRSYVRNRLSKGTTIFFWWLESQTVDPHTDCTIRFFDELNDIGKLNLMWEELVLFPQIVHNNHMHYQLDTRILHFFHKHRTLYPQQECIYKTILPQISIKEDRAKIVEEHGDNIQLVYDNMSVNLFRQYSDWWDENSNYEQWANIFLKL